MKKKQDVSKVKKQKKVLDLDAALEEVAQKLRPTAYAGDGDNTRVYGTNGSPSSCPQVYCCSASDELQ